LKGWIQLSGSTDAILSTTSNSAPNAYVFRVTSTYTNVWGKSLTLAGGGSSLATDSAESKVYMASTTASNRVVVELDATTGAYSTGYQM